MMILNVPVADFICQIRFDNLSYFKQFKKEYAYLDNSRRFDWNVEIIQTDKNEVQVDIDDDSSQAVIGLPHQKKFAFNYLSFFVETAIASLALKEDILFLHASTLVKDGKVYVFCGDVGAGKSTVRNLASGLPSLSDDTTIVRKERNEYFIYSSPFDKNKVKIISGLKCNLFKILFLKKAKKNKIYYLLPLDALTKLNSTNLLSKVGWLKDKYNLHRLNLDLISRISMGTLYFKKDQNFLGLI